MHQDHPEQPKLLRCNGSGERARRDSNPNLLIQVAGIVPILPTLSRRRGDERDLILRRKDLPVAAGEVAAVIDLSVYRSAAR